MAPLIPVAQPDLSELEVEYVMQAVRSGWVSSIGEFIDRFERAFAELCGTSHCIALSNGTVALHLALVARGIGPGDEVLVPDLTFVATAAAVRQAGAVPVLVDVDPKTWCIDTDQAARAISPRTRAIIPVHLFGHPADMGTLRDLASQHSLFLLEDAAEAHGARFGGRVVGGLGDAACFSFYGNKLLTTGEGGAITTSDAKLAQRVRFLKDHAMSPTQRYYHPEVGYNYRMTNLQAALGCAQVERFSELLQKKARVLGWYREALTGTAIELNPQGPGADPVCWLVVAQLPGEWSSERQQRLMRIMVGNGVDVRPFFVPLHELPPYRECRFMHGELARSGSIARSGICLPSSNTLSPEQVAHISSVLRRAVDESGAAG